MSEGGGSTLPRANRTGGGSTAILTLCSAGDHTVGIGVDPLRRYAHAASREPQEIGDRNDFCPPGQPG